MAVCQDFDHPDLQPRVLHVGTCYATQKGNQGADGTKAGGHLPQRWGEPPDHPSRPSVTT